MYVHYAACDYAGAARTLASLLDAARPGMGTTVHLLDQWAIWRAAASFWLHVGDPKEAAVWADELLISVEDAPLPPDVPHAVHQAFRGEAHTLELLIAAAQIARGEKYSAVDVAVDDPSFHHQMGSEAWEHVRLEEANPLRGVLPSGEVGEAALELAMSQCLAALRQWRPHDADTTARDAQGVPIPSGLHDVNQDGLDDRFGAIDFAESALSMLPRSTLVDSSEDDAGADVDAKPASSSDAGGSETRDHESSSASASSSSSSSSTPTSGPDSSASPMSAAGLNVGHAGSETAFQPVYADAELLRARASTFLADMLLRGPHLPSSSSSSSSSPSTSTPTSSSTSSASSFSSSTSSSGAWLSPEGLKLINGAVRRAQHALTIIEGLEQDPVAAILFPTAQRKAAHARALAALALAHHRLQRPVLAEGFFRSALDSLEALGKAQSLHPAERAGWAQAGLDYAALLREWDRRTGEATSIEAAARSIPVAVKGLRRPGTPGSGIGDADHARALAVGGIPLVVPAWGFAHDMVRVLARLH